MPRLPFVSAMMLACCPAALFAAPTEVSARIEAVTLFPWGAQVTRTVRVPEGASEVLVPNLPDHTDPAALRVAADPGLSLGAVTLIDERQPAAADVPTQELKAARAALDAAAEALAGQQDDVARLKAAATAAAAQVDFFKTIDTSSTPPEKLAALAQTVGAGVLAAQQARVGALAQVRRAEAGLKPARDAVEKARRAVEALEHPVTGSDSLLLAVSGAGTLTITTYTDAAGWTPSYDVRLDSAAGRLAFDRFVSVHQASGEDWSDVRLTLSTARPSDRSEPGELWPDLRRIAPPELPMDRRVSMAAPKVAMDAYEAPVVEAAPVAENMGVGMQGETVVYTYPGAVDIRDGVEDLRLKLDRVDASVTVLAEAVPMLEETAYRVAEGVNGSEPLLPGAAALWLDGAMVGTANLPFTAAGDTLRLGFGAIDGLKLKRVIPQTNEGDRGLISKSNERTERAEITVENLTGKAWPVRLIDRVPYSEQEDLQITHSATPPETASDWDDKRGLLAWEFDLAPGKTQVVTLETKMRWPADQDLR